MTLIGTPAAPGRSRRLRRDGPPLVLLAEDDDEMRWLVAEKLRRRGCNVLEARTGPQLAELVVERLVEPVPRTLARASAVITDLRMPGCTGMEILALLRRFDEDTPVILITAFGDAATHAEATLFGAAAVFDKPIDLDVLVDATWAAMAARGATS